MSEWISVESNPPSGGTVVLVCFKGVVQHQTYWMDDGDGSWVPTCNDCDHAPAGTFEYWMPLPEPPKEEGNV